MIELADDDNLILLTVRYPDNLGGELIETIDNLGLGMAMRLTANELTFIDDPENPGSKIFSMFVQSEEQETIVQAFAEQSEQFRVSFSNPEIHEPSPEDLAAAEARLRAKGWWPEP